MDKSLHDESSSQQQPANLEPFELAIAFFLVLMVSLMLQMKIKTSFSQHQIKLRISVKELFHHKPINWRPETKKLKEPILETAIFQKKVSFLNQIQYLNLKYY